MTPSPSNEQAAAGLTPVAAFVEHARHYSELGWALIRVDGKKAKGNGWQQTQPDRDVEHAAGQWATWGSRWNIGVVLGPSKLAVVEYDTDRAGRQLLELLDGSLPETPVALTGSGRHHLYFRAPNSVEKAARDGLELRVGAHMCVLPPSVHPTTNKVYRWLGGLEPWAMPLGDVPAAVLAYFAETRRNGRAEPVADVIPKGKRDDTLASLAGTMRRRGMGENEILAALQAVNRERCKPPLNERDIKRIARSVASKKPEQRERDDKPFELSVQTARGICALPDPPWSDELLGPLVVRGQRLILGGHTGEGKTTAMLQIIRAIVLGESFLDWQGSSGRALVIDAEQGLKTIKRRLREAGLGDSDLVDYVRVPDGLELDSDERHIAEVERVLEAGGYALVAADPLYKLHAGDSNAEREAVDLMRRFDAWRERLRFALLLPVHCRKPVPGTKFSIHDLFGSSAYVRGAEVVLGLQRVSDGYARLHFLKDRDGDLPISTAWGLLFNREEGFRRDPDDGKTRDIRAELLEALADSEWRTVTELRRKEEDGGIGADPKTIRPVLDALTDEEQLEYCIGPAGKPRNAKCWRVPSSAPNDGDDGTLFSGHSGDPGGAAVVPSSPYIGDGDDDDGTDTAPASPRAVVNPHDGTLT